MKLDLKPYAVDIHQNAVEHGWWETERSEGETFALIHSEWSEALEEYRCGRGNVWEGEHGKPEGVAVELIDGVIRILDYMEHDRIRYIPVNDVFVKESDLNCTLPEIVNKLHNLTAMNCCIATITLVFEWCNRQGIDPVELMMKKHEYNKSRPYRHGGKKA